MMQLLLSQHLGRTNLLKKKETFYVLEGKIEKRDREAKVSERQLEYSTMGKGNPWDNTKWGLLTNAEAKVVHYVRVPLNQAAAYRGAEEQWTCIFN